MPEKLKKTPEEKIASRKATQARYHQKWKAKKRTEAARDSDQQVSPVPKDVIDAPSDWKAKSWDGLEKAKFAQDSTLIRLCWSTSDKFEDKSHLLAGYFNLADTSELKELIFDERSIDICRSWMQAMEDNYGITKGVMSLPKAIIKKTFFKFISDDSIQTVLIENAMDRRIFSNTFEKQYAVFAYHILMLLRTDRFRRVFCGGLQGPDKNPTTCHGFNAEDWGRGAFWILYMARLISKSFTVINSYVWKANDNNEVPDQTEDAAHSSNNKKLGVLDHLTNEEVQKKLQNPNRYNFPSLNAAVPVYWAQHDLDYTAPPETPGLGPSDESGLGASDEPEWEGLEESEWEGFDD